MRLALVVAHDGTDFEGWQLQDGRRTVQGVLEEALARPCGPVRLHASGRTDAGVHALGQVVHGDLERPWTEPLTGLRHRLNAILPEDLVVRGVAEMPESFHSRKSARSKTYRYRLRLAPLRDPLSQRQRVQVGGGLDREAMAEAGRRFLGQRDFASLQSSGSSVKTSVRELTECKLVDAGTELDVVVTGDGFLRHMVRALVGCLLEVGRGARSPDWIDEVLERADRQAAGPNAPARGLCLERVSYEPEFQERLDRAVSAVGEALT
ncbi:MAG: tRNA pseudouridine(38-40) synthase TruA [Acidobacteriota bacterium]